MKRFIAALSLGLASASVLAQPGKPFEQIDIDRALPSLPESTVTATVYQPTALAAASTETRSDAEIAVEEPQATESPFANDWNFVAPAP